MKKLLIVDDSASMRQSMIRILRQADISAGALVEARNGKEGLQKVLSDPEIGIVLSDINMPEMNGIDLLKALRDLHGKEDLPVLMITSEGGEAMRSSALACGANGYVTKPFSADTVRSALEGYLD